MSDPKTIKDALPPEDGWVAIIPFQHWELKSLPEGSIEQFMDKLGPTVEFTFEGFYDDMGAP